ITSMSWTTRASTALALAVAVFALPLLLDQCAASCEAHRRMATTSEPTCHDSASVTTRIGQMRDVLQMGEFEGGIGADVTFYDVPGALQSAYGSHPASFHVFFRLRPPAGSMGRMW